MLFAYATFDEWKIDFPWNNLCCDCCVLMLKWVESRITEEYSERVLALARMRGRQLALISDIVMAFALALNSYIISSEIAVSVIRTVSFLCTSPKSRRQKCWRMGKRCCSNAENPNSIPKICRCVWCCIILDNCDRWHLMYLFDTPGRLSTRRWCFYLSITISVQVHVLSLSVTFENDNGWIETICLFDISVHMSRSANRWRIGQKSDCFRCAKDMNEQDKDKFHFVCFRCQHCVTWCDHRRHVGRCSGCCCRINKQVKNQTFPFTYSL